MARCISRTRSSVNWQAWSWRYRTGGKPHYANAGPRESLRVVPVCAGATECEQSAGLHRVASGRWHGAPQPVKQHVEAVRIRDGLRLRARLDMWPCQALSAVESTTGMRVTA